MIDIPSKDVLAALRTESPIHVPITSSGYVGVAKDKGEDQFLIRFIPFYGVSLVLGRVASTCTPHENFLNQNALIIESCGPKSPDVYLDTWTTDGKKLWSGHREGHLVWPTFAYSRTGDRSAVSLLHVSHYVDLVDSLNDEDVREQVVQVFDTATGALLMSTTASPVLTAGRTLRSQMMESTWQSCARARSRSTRCLRPQRRTKPTLRWQRRSEPIFKGPMVGAPAFMRGKERFSAPGNRSRALALAMLGRVHVSGTALQAAERSMLLEGTTSRIVINDCNRVRL